MPDARVLTVFGPASAVPTVSAEGAELLTTTGKVPASAIGHIPGHFDPHAYGAVGDGVTDDSPAFAALMADIGTLVGSIVYDTHAATIQLSERKTYYLTENLVLDRNYRIRGVGGGSYSDLMSSRLKFAPGKGIWIRGITGLSRPYGVGATLEDIAVDCQSLNPPTWQYGTAYNVGDIVCRPDDHEMVWECIVAGTSMARPYPAWQASHAYSPGDKITPADFTRGGGGHTYTCVTGGTSHSTEPPWPFAPTATITETGGVKWIESTRIDFAPTTTEYSSSHFLDGTARWTTDTRMRPFAAATDPEVLWTPGHVYRYNDVVRVAGITDTVFFIADPYVNGTAAGATPPTSGAPATTVSDGVLTWTRLDGSQYLTTDGTVVWQPRLHCGVAIDVQCTVRNCCVNNATCDAYHIQGSATGTPPFSVADNCTFIGANGAGSHGFIRTRGGDGSESTFLNCSSQSVYYDGVRQLEWDKGCNDGGQFGNVWISCLMQSFSGSSFIQSSAVATSTFIGCYQESLAPSCIRNGIILGGWLASGQFTIDSNALRFHGPQATNLYTADPQGAGYLYSWLGKQTSASLAGRAVFAHQAVGLGETYEHALCWSDTLSGWPTGFWVQTYAPGTDAGNFASFAYAGDAAAVYKDAALAKGQLWLGSSRPAGCFLWGDPYTGFNAVALRGIDTAPLGSSTKMWRSDSVTAAYGKWRAGDHVFNMTPDVNPFVGWVCTAGDDTALGTWAPYGIAGHLTGAQTPVAMADANQTMSALDASSAIIKTTGALTANRTLRIPAPTSDANACQKTIRNACTGAFSILVDIVGGAAPVTIANGKTAIVGFDATGAFRVTADA